MEAPTEISVTTGLREILARAVGCAVEEVEIRHTGGQPNHAVDFQARAGGHEFKVEYKRSPAAGSVANAIGSLAKSPGDGIRLVAVPFMPPGGRRLCEDLRTNWVDLCGNASISAPGLRVFIEGHPNMYAQPGRPPNIFAPKSSRIAHRLLLRPQDFQTQSQLAALAHLDDGYTSKIVRRLEEHEYLDLDRDGAVRPRSPHLLLDAWASAYRFQPREIKRLHVPSKEHFEELLRFVAQELTAQGVEYAITGSSAANFVVNPATATLYVQELPASFEPHELTQGPNPPNVSLVVPEDPDDVFRSTRTRDGLNFASPIRAYLDLFVSEEPKIARELRHTFFLEGAS